MLTPEWYNSPHISAMLTEQYMEHKINCYMQPYYIIRLFDLTLTVLQGDQKVSVHLMFKIQKVTSNVESVLRQSPDIY